MLGPPITRPLPFGRGACMRRPSIASTAHQSSGRPRQAATAAASLWDRQCRRCGSPARPPSGSAVLQMAGKQHAAACRRFSCSPRRCRRRRPLPPPERPRRPRSPLVLPLSPTPAELQLGAHGGAAHQRGPRARWIGRNAVGQDEGEHGRPRGARAPHRPGREEAQEGAGRRGRRGLRPAQAPQGEVGLVWWGVGIEESSGCWAGCCRRRRRRLALAPHSRSSPLSPLHSRARRAA